KVLLRLMQQDRIPVRFLEWVADCSHKKVLLTLLINPNTSVSALDKLRQSQEPEVVDAVKLHVNWRQELGNIDEVLTKAVAISDLERSWDDEYKLLKLRVIPDFILPVFDDFTRLIIAEEPHTSAKVLTQLIRDSDKHREPEIKIAVAKHPNTPKNLLENFLGDDRVRYVAANNPNTPLNVVQKFYHQYNAVSNPDTPSEILSQFASSRWQTIRLGVARHQNTPANLLEQFAVVDSLQLRLTVAFNISTPIHVFEQLIKDNYWEVRWAVAQNLSTPAYILEQLVEDTCAYVRDIAEERLDVTNETAYSDSHILLSPNLVPRDKYADDGIQRMQILSEEISLAHKAYVQTIKVSQLSDVVKDVKNGGWQFRTYLLPPSTPIDILQQLADSQDEQDRREVASHKHTPASILAQLAIDESKLVRREVAGNPNTAVSILEQLALDEEQEVRRAIGSNSNTSISILLQFINENNDVSDEAANNLNKQILYNPDIPATLLQQLSEVQSQEITIAVGRHPNTPVSILEQLAENQNWKVRLSVAQNPSTPVTTRERLLQDENIYVRSGAASNISDINHSEQSTVVESLVRDVAPKVLKKYAQHSTPTLSRLITFFHPQTPTQYLAKNFRSPIWLNRYAIAQNPSTPRHIVQKLTEDGNHVVRNAAMSNLAQYPILTNQPDDYSNVSLHLPSLFRGEALSAEILEQAASLSSKKILLAVANHPNTPKSILEKSTLSRHPEVVKAARFHVNLAGEINDGWDEVAKSEIKTATLQKNLDELEEFAEIGVIPQFIIEQLFEDERKEIHIKLAAYNIPINVFQKRLLRT
ncbi:HEAT repeat domain-containing protein, partial [Dulcicalothrix desertica]